MESEVTPMLQFGVTPDSESGVSTDSDSELSPDSDSDVRLSSGKVYLYTFSHFEMHTNSTLICTLIANIIMKV